MNKETLIKMFKKSLKDNTPIFFLEKENYKIEINWLKWGKFIWIFRLNDKKTEIEKGLSYFLLTNKKQYMKENKLLKCNIV